MLMENVYECFMHSSHPQQDTKTGGWAESRDDDVGGLVNEGDEEFALVHGGTSSAGAAAGYLRPHKSTPHRKMLSG